MTTRLISVDSHVKVTPEQLRELIPTKYHSDWDGAVAAEEEQQQREMGGVDRSVMVAGFSRSGLAESSTVALLIAPLPVLVEAAAVASAEAAAIPEGSVSTVVKLEAAFAVGWTRNSSPDAGVPDSVIVTPFAVIVGAAAVPPAVNATLPPVL